MNLIPENKQFQKLQRLLPLFIFASLGVGVLIGTGMSISSKNSKLEKILGLIDQQYVDSLDVSQIENEAIEELLKRLDPHSVYIPKDLSKDYDIALEGSFEGIGVYFSIVQDSIVISAVIENGPAYKAGVLTGDRIIAANNTPLLKERLDYDSISKYLKGVAGSEVVVAVVRPGEKEIKELPVKRGSVALKSVSNAFIERKIGYLKIENFGTHTFEEFMDGMKSLTKQGAHKVVLDFRGNTGGYLHIAENILSELLDKGVPIFYTQGKNSPRVAYESQKDGRYRNMPLVVLINEESASASEVVAGAVQDSDRGFIVGRRSFGKGLVQEDKELKDGSRLRLTIARYYTPSGRCIQKPYDSYQNDDYSGRLESGELFSKDSVHVNDTSVYYTAGGRKVYAGGGIMPDYYIPLDTNKSSFILSQMYYKSVFKSSAVTIYSLEHEEIMKKFPKAQDFALNYQLDEELLKQLFSRYYYLGLSEVGLSQEEMKIASSYVKMELASYLYPHYSSLIRWKMGYDEIMDKAFDILENQNTALILESDYMMPASY